MAKNMARLQNIANEAGTAKKPSSKIKILFGPSFAIYHAMKIHDILLSALLTTKGAGVYYLSSPFGLPACNVCGGIRQVLNPDPKLCPSCLRFYRNDNNLTSYLKKFATIFSPQEFVKPEQISLLGSAVSKIPDEVLEIYTYEGLPIGQYAAAIVKNLGYVGNISIVPNHEKLLRETMLSCLIYLHYFQEAITKGIKPDIIVSHDAFYAPWALLRDLAKKNHIPFYNYYSGLRHNTFHYAKNQVAMLLNIDPLFEKWKNREIKKSELLKLEPIFSKRKKGKIYHEKDTWKDDQNERNQFAKMLASNKPLAVLYGNVLWDLTALDREVVFPSIQESFRETVKFFINHPEYNLVVKPHPGELGGIHESKEKLEESIRSRFPELPSNIIILNPKSAITSYELIENSQVSIVYTTTVGMESVILGKPTIALGRSQYRKQGFTHDPETPGEFFDTLKRLLESPLPDIAKEQALAKKYYYLYFFVYFHDFKIVEFDLVNKTQVIPKSLNDLLSNKDFNSLADAIVQKQDVPYFDSYLAQ